MRCSCYPSRLQHLMPGLVAKPNLHSKNYVATPFSSKGFRLGQIRCFWFVTWPCHKRRFFAFVRHCSYFLVLSAIVEAFVGELCIMQDFDVFLLKLITFAYILEYVHVLASTCTSTMVGHRVHVLRAHCQVVRLLEYTYPVLRQYIHNNTSYRAQARATS